MRRALALTLILLPLSLSAATPIKLRLATNVGYAPLTVTYYVSLEPHEGNRLLCIDWDGDGEAGRHCEQVEPGVAAVHTRLKFGTGNYTVQATLLRVVDGKREYHVDKAQLQVLEPGTPTVR